MGFKTILNSIRISILKAKILQAHKDIEFYDLKQNYYNQSNDHSNWRSFNDLLFKQRDIVYDLDCKLLELLKK